MRSAALSCAEHSDKAAALLREYAAGLRGLEFADELLNSESLTPAA